MGRGCRLSVGRTSSKRDAQMKLNIFKNDRENLPTRAKREDQRWVRVLFFGTYDNLALFAANLSTRKSCVVSEVCVNH